MWSNDSLLNRQFLDWREFHKVAEFHNCFGYSRSFYDSLQINVIQRQSAARTSSQCDVMTACTEQILGNDRVSSETVGFCTSQVESGHEQCVTADLHVHTQFYDT